MKMKNARLTGDKACRFVRSHLVSIVEMGVAETDFPGLRDHLASCPECASLLGTFSEAWENPAPAPEPEPSPAFFPGLIARIEAEGEEPSARPGILAVVRRVLWPAAVAALFGAGIFAGHELGRRARPAPSSEAPFSDQLLQSFENIPAGSVADFYVGPASSGKEGRT